MRPALLLTGANTIGACVLSVTAGRHALHDQYPQAVVAAVITALLVAAAVREEQHGDRVHAMREAFARVAHDGRHAGAAAAEDQLAILRAAVDEACCLDALRTSHQTHHEELRHQLAVEFERERKAREDAGYSQGAFDFERQPLSATEATFDRAILNGDEVTPEEIDRASAWCRTNGIPTTYATNVARGHRSMEQNGIEVISPEAVPVVAVPRHRRERMLRGEVNTLAGKVAYRMGMPKKDFNYWLRKEGFPPRAKATIEDLERMEVFLVKKLGEL